MATTMMAAAEEGRHNEWEVGGGDRGCEPKAFLLPKQGGGGVAKARQGRGVRHVGAERRGKKEDLVGGGFPQWRTVCGAWLNQQFGL